MHGQQNIKTLSVVCHYWNSFRVKEFGGASSCNGGLVVALELSIQQI